ncbi:Terpene synthase metal-binding domain protein-like protein, partial [Leptotrombidium deliense]
NKPPKMSICECEEKLYSYEYPKLLMPFEPHVNQFKNSVNSILLDSVLKFGYYTEKDTLIINSIIDFCCECFPSADLNRLLLSSKYILNVFTFDDSVMENKQGQFFSNIMAIQQEDIKCEIKLLDSAKFDKHSPVAQSFYDYWSAMKIYTNQIWQKRFAKSFITYVKSMNWEKSQLENNLIPKLDEYKKMRIETGAVEASLNVLAFSLNIFLSDEVMSNTVIQSLHNSAARHSLFINDFTSFEKERRDGEMCNLVIAIKHEYNISYQEAIFKAGEILDDEVKIFLNNFHSIPSFGIEIDLEVKKYVLGLQQWIKSNYDFSITSCRYPRLKYTKSEL